MLLHISVVAVCLGALQQAYLASSGSSEIKLSESEWASAFHMIEEMVNRSEVLEKNIAKSKTTHIEERTRTFDLTLNSWAGDEALLEAKQGYIFAKTSSSIAHTKCSRSNTTECLKALSNFIKSPKPEMYCGDEKYRQPSGKCNNKDFPEWGSAQTAYSRILPATYSDGIWSNPCESRNCPNPLKVSSELTKRIQPKPGRTTPALAAWANLVAFDMAHTAAYRAFFTKSNIKCCGEHHFRLLPRYRHPLCSYMTGPDDTCVSYVRSMLAVPNESPLGPAQQMNTVSHFLDGSTIYGSSLEIEESLRTHLGGKIQSTPTNEIVRNNVNCVEKNKCYLTADLRNILSPSNMVLNSLFIREHNRIASVLELLNPKWNDEKLFLETKRLVVAELQHITYNEWLPLIIGYESVKVSKVLDIPEGYSNVYDSNVDPSVSNEFANAAMRFADQLNESYLRLYKGEFKSDTSLRYTAIEPHKLKKELIESVAKSLVSTESNSSERFWLSEEAINYFVSEDDDSELSPLSIDIHRGREHGFPPYTSYTMLFKEPTRPLKKQNLPVSLPRESVTDLMNLYKKTDTLDLIVGGLLERPTKGSLVGETFKRIIKLQMEATKAGDRYFYDNKDQPHPFSNDQLNEIKKSSFARLLCDNFGNIEEIQRFPFIEKSHIRNPPISCNDESKLNKVNMRFWQQ